MKILIACEFSGVVRDAFIKKGHDAWSCDLLQSESTELGYHLQGDVLNWIYGANAWGWDLMIAFPPCTYLCGSGARWWKDRQQFQDESISFVKLLMAAPIERICIENPVGKLSTAIRKPDQIIQPWMFGHGETKKTCLWLKNLPKLIPTNIVDGRKPCVHFCPPSKDRWKKRSITYQGIADAMADQWGIEV